MNIRLLVIGKTNEKYLQSGLDEYTKRLGRFVRFEMEVIPDLKGAKSLRGEEIKQREGALILERLGARSSSEHVILLDERGKAYSSIEFADFLSDMTMRGVKRLNFVVGGAYGFSSEVYARADGKITLSRMTFSHQMVRLFFVEQIYRGYAIINGLPYHNE